MKKYILLLLILSRQSALFACAACEAQQPKILRNISHGLGPDGWWDYAIVYVGLILTIAVLVYSLKWLFKPGETSSHHIKQFILNND